MDVLYFDPSDLREETEKRYEAALQSQFSVYQWSVKNQARMHIRNHNKPYPNVADAMKRWPETATAVGLSLDKEGSLQVIAPHGLDDLLGLLVRRSPFFKDEAYFYERINSKRWLELWPKLKVVT